jgi:hypothetical protein
MNEIPINQTWYKVIIDTTFSEETFANAATIEMKFKSPKNVETKVTATRITGTSKIEYALTIDKIVLNQIGIWKVWPYITALDGRIAPSKKAISILVIPEGTV